jgi:predicted nucleic acid-binding protein
MDAFDADVLIYAAIPDHPLGRRVRASFRLDLSRSVSRSVGVGSVLLVPELLSKPLRLTLHREVEALTVLLGRLDLIPVDVAVARAASALGATYGLRAADAVHLATAVAAGADRFITNNRADFLRAITEVDVVYPEDLPEV